MRTADAIVEVLKREGVTTLFCFPTTSIIENAVAAGIRPIICRQERVGVDMADGFARVTNGRPPGVFAMQYGPGSENAFPGIATTYSDSVPVLFLPLAQSRDQSQVYPIFMANRTYASVTKQVEEIRMPESDPGGDAARLQRAEERPRRAGDGRSAARCRWIWTSAPTRWTTRRCGQRCPRPTRDVDEAAKLLIGARCPVILAGQGVLYAEASAELVELAELLQAPVMTTVDGKSAFPEDHALALGSGGNTFSGPGRLFLHTKADLIFGDRHRA